jgi:hypothetical protein
MTSFVLYGEDSRQRLLGEAAIALSQQGQEELSRRRAPLFDSADEAESLGFAACARELRAGGTFLVKCGSAVVECRCGSSAEAIAELRSGLGLAHVAYRLASDDAFRVEGETARALVDLEWFAEVDKRSLFAVASHGAAKSKMELHLTLFEPPDSDGRRRVHEIAAQLRREKRTTVHLVAAVDDASGFSLAGVVARACARVFEWDDQRLLALYSSPKSPFILQLVGEEFHARYRAFFASPEGKAAFPRQEAFDTTDRSNMHVQKFLGRVRERGAGPCKRIEVFFPAVPILAAFSNGESILFQCRDVIEQVVSKHRRDDIVTPQLASLERDVLLNLEDGASQKRSYRYAYLHRFAFQKGDGARLVDAVRRAPQLGMVNLDFTTGLEVDAVRALLALDHVCAVSLVGSDVAAAAAVACAAQSGKLLCDYAWRSACHTLAPLADDVRRKRYLHACLATVRFDAENLLADHSVQTT